MYNFKSKNKKTNLKIENDRTNNSVILICTSNSEKTNLLQRIQNSFDALFGNYHNIVALDYNDAIDFADQIKHVIMEDEDV